MPNLIIVRLRPVNPTSGSDFGSALTGLTVEAFDLSVGDSLVGTSIGSTTGVFTSSAPGDDTVDVTVTGIIQDYVDVPDPVNPMLTIRSAQAAATAVIVVSVPAGHPEYPTATSFDLRLALNRGGPIADLRTDPNISVVTSMTTLSTDENDYLILPPSAYATIPAASLGVGAHLQLSADGTPPPFAPLVTAIDAVLALDPDDGQTLAARAQLSAAQSHQIAVELVWDRTLSPPPDEPRPLAQMYTNPTADTSVKTDDAENDRRKFEAEQAGYYATLDASALALTGFVYAASAAMLSERVTAGADIPGAGPGGAVLPGARTALLGFPLPAGASDGTAQTDTAVVLTGSTAAAPLDPPFIVPAAYFYAISSQLPTQVDAGQRLSMATADTEAKLLVAIQAALDAGVVTDTELPSTTAAPAPINLLTVSPAQAARRLRAIGQARSGAPQVPLEPPLTALVTDWLAFTGPTSTMDQDFWTAAETGSPAYLNLLLHVITDNYQPLIDAIALPPLSVTTATELLAVTDQEWRDFFLPPGQPPQLTLLPPFTQVGPASTPQDRTEAFIRHLRTFFSVPFTPLIAAPPPPDAPPTFPVTSGDVFARFMDAYATHGGGAYQPSIALDPTAAAAAVSDVFPDDGDAQAWLTGVLAALADLSTLTAFAATPQLQFSLMEALYARGLTSRAGVQALTDSQLSAALEGSVAYPVAASIMTAAGGSTATAPAVPGSFQPVNPTGDLTDCVPPAHLSPFGPITYLGELLQLAPRSTCDQPLAPDAPDTLMVQLSTRRGPLGELHATAADLATPVPVIDLVNESLEALTAAVAAAAPVTGGAVFDTDPTGVPGHLVDPASSLGAGGELATVLTAVPQHSAPATTALSAAGVSAYAALRLDASAPELPYDQPIDTVRSYLEDAGASRFELLRRFRRATTEFVLDPTNQPADFADQVWRYPVALPAALEYLCITPTEYALIFTPQSRSEIQTGTDPWTLYGFAAPNFGDNEQNWTDVAVQLPEFLARTGLAYCELVELQSSALVPFRAVSGEHQKNQDDTGVLPECEPCDLDRWRLEFDSLSSPENPDNPENPDDDTLDVTPLGLYRLMLVIRLWRRLRDRCEGGLTFCVLADIATVVPIFRSDLTSADAAVDLNPDLLRQLAALLMLADDFGLPLVADCCCLPSEPVPLDRIPLLALWDPAADADQSARAIELLLDGLERTANRREPGLTVSPELVKVIAANLDPLSQLCGFDPATPGDGWAAAPTHTLRFAEVLLKVYLSPFSVGELVFLFTTGEHLTGDDPFPLTDDSDAIEDPLSLGADDDDDDAGPHSLWRLRHTLRTVTVNDENNDKVEAWSWSRMMAAFQLQFGYVPPASGPDPLDDLHRLVFGTPHHHGGAPASGDRWSVDLPATDTSPLMWTGGPPDGPFGYDPAAEQLWVQLPLKDGAVLDRLLNLRPLNPQERQAVRDLYFAPRAALAPFAAVFENPVREIEELVQEEDPGIRWGRFQASFALFHRRCELIAEHLADHVQSVTDPDSSPDADHHSDHDSGHHSGHDHHAHDHRTARIARAWRVLRSLWADENFAHTPWEADSGLTPDVTWTLRPAGSAFAALLGVLGTGLVGEYGHPADCPPAQSGSGVLWREIRGPLEAFGHARNEWNAPVPTVIPAFDLTLTSAQSHYIGLRNGLALVDRTGKPLGGAQPFTVQWAGVLLVEQDGHYTFHAGPHHHHDHENHGHEHESHDHHDRPDDEHGPDCDGRTWRVRLARGQRHWTVLNHGWPGDEAPGHRSGRLLLRRGAYDIVVEAEQSEPTFDGDPRFEDLHPVRTGFWFGYSGPDTEGATRTLPFDHLFRATADSTLSYDVDRLSPTEEAAAWLDGLYVSSLRDVRRTYQRAFKALLLTARFELSAEPTPGYRQSELGYLLDHPEAFAGSAYPRTGPSSFGTHLAGFDVNLLPVADPYPPTAVTALPPTEYPAGPDQRSDPSPARQAAWFDVWERLYDYRDLRRQTRGARERPAWLLFAEVSEQQPDDPVNLLRHLGIDLSLAPAVTTFYDPATDPDPYRIAVDDLENERWAVRTWRASTWLERMAGHLVPLAIDDAEPWLWSTDEPGTAIGAPPVSGTANLVGLVQAAYLEATPARVRDLRQLNDCLRDRARDALLAYLLGMDRVPLPGTPGTFAGSPVDLSDLLLQDVGTGLGDQLSRIEDAVGAARSYLQRALLGLEPTLVVGAGLQQLWQCRFAGFDTWRVGARQQAYREEWIGWDDLALAQRSEAFTMLQERLREDTLSVPVPGGLSWWPGRRPGPHPGLELLQDREPSALWLLQPPVPEGLGLLGSPESPAQPSWLSPVVGPPTPATPVTPTDPNNPLHTPDGEPGPSAATIAGPPTPVAPADDRLPLWLSAAITLGTPFLRVAAAGIPPASARLTGSVLGSTTSLSGSGFGVPSACGPDCADPDRNATDEYYFWLGSTSMFDELDPVTDADAGVVVSTAADPTDQTSDWHRDTTLPGLLSWPPRPAVHLWWCRIHDGEPQTPRHSVESLTPDPGSTATLVFAGRQGDSLQFGVPGVAPPVGYLDPTLPGFRYDLPTDAAVVLPLVTAPIAPPAGGPAGLAAYPYFTFVPPGAPLLPLNPFPVATTIAAALRPLGHYDAALAWYDTVYRALDRDNTWDTRSFLDNQDRRERAVLLDYLQTLLEAVDAQVCRNSRESAATARTVLDVFSRVLGPTPRRVDGADDDPPQTLDGFSPRPAPLSRRLVSLYEQRDDRAEVVRRSLDARGNRRGDRRPGEDYWTPGSDLEIVRALTGRVVDPCCVDADGCDGQVGCECECGTGPYRFRYLLQKAMELSGEVRSLGAGLLAAFEKGDAETLASIRAGHERQLLELALRTRQFQWREADWQVQALDETKQGALARLAYYRKLLQDGHNAGEIGYETLTGVSIASRTGADISEAIAQGVGIVPDMWIGVAGVMGTPLQFNQLPVGNKLASGFSTAARIMNGIAEIASTSAGLSLTEGNWDRREQEWQQQVEVITIELAQIERQILAAERHRDAAARDLAGHEQQIEHATQVQDYLRDKFTNPQLYLYLERETAALHRQMLDLAGQAFRRAGHAFTHERGTSGLSFAVPAPGRGTRRQLTAGDELQLALRRMDTAYQEENCREYELTKHLSLRLDFPLAFLQLQQTGFTEIDVPEWMFDVDYPGHYLRRIKNLTVTVPCVVGPYTGVHARLTLLDSRTRIAPTLLTPAASCCGTCGGTSSGCGCDSSAPVDCTCRSGRRCGCATGACRSCVTEPVDPALGYAAIADDPRIQRTYAASDAIATSSGQNDSGLFELNFTDDRYLPFEFRGAVSRWRIELPPENNRFDLDTVTDVVLRLNYTAREGGDRLREAAAADARGQLPGAGVRLFDVSQDFPDDWYRLTAPGDPEADPAAGCWPVRLSPAHFPFLVSGCDVRVTGMQLFVEVCDPGCEGALPVRFVRDHVRPHRPGEPCGCPGEEFDCLAGVDWPCLFHGVVDIDPISLGRRRRGGTPVGEFRFDDLPGEIRAIFLVCTYDQASADHSSAREAGFRRPR